MTRERPASAKPPAPAVPDADALGWRMEALFGQVARQVFAHASRLIEGEMTFARLMAMFHLYREGPQTIAELAQGALLSHAAASRMVDGLVRLDIVSRTPGTGDRRQRQVALTALGRERLDSLRKITAHGFGELFDGLPVESRASMDQVLDALAPRLTLHDRMPAVSEPEANARQPVENRAAPAPSATRTSPPRSARP